MKNEKINFKLSKTHLKQKFKLDYKNGEEPFIVIERIIINTLPNGASDNWLNYLINNQIGFKVIVKDDEGFKNTLNYRLLDFNITTKNPPTFKLDNFYFPTEDQQSISVTELNYEEVIFELTYENDINEEFEITFLCSTSGKVS